MASVVIHPAVQLVWAIANVEACLAGENQIGTVHLLLGTLKVIDDAFLEEIHRLGLSSEIEQDLRESVNKCREIVQMKGRRITVARRAVRKEFSKAVEGPVVQALRLAPESLDLFHRATREVRPNSPPIITLASLCENLMTALPDAVSQLLQSNQEPGGGAGPERAEEARAAKEETDPGGKNATAAGDDPFLLRMKASAVRPGATPLLGELGRDLTALARVGELSPPGEAIGEEDVLARYLQYPAGLRLLILSNARVRNAEIIERIALRMARDPSTPLARHLRLVEINLESWLDESAQVSDLENRFRGLLSEIIAHPQVIPVLWGVHRLLNAGATDAPARALSGLFVKALAHQNFRCLAEMTREEFDRSLVHARPILKQFHVFHCP